MPESRSLQTLEEPDDTEPVSAPACVLIVDDEPLNRFLIAEALAADHYRIVEAESGEAAVEYMMGHKVDLILLDIDMPGMGGLAACKAIRALPQGKLVPIAMVTGLDDNESVERAFDCGATDFLTKPVNWPLMRQRVRFMLRYGSITRTQRRNEQILEQVHEIAEVGYWQWDIANHIIYHSTSYCRLVPGLPPRIADSVFDTDTTSEYGQRVLAEVRRAMDSGEHGFRFECSVNIPGRGKRRLLYHGSIEYRGDKPQHMISAVQDITQRYRDEERFAVIFDESPVGIIEADSSYLLEITQRPDFYRYDKKQLRTEVIALLAARPDNLFYVKVNPAAQRMLGHSNGDPQLMELRKELTLNFLLGIRNRERQMIMQCRLPQGGGESSTVVISSHLPSTPEDYKRVVVSISDITDLTRREAQLKRADAIIANTGDAVAVMDKNRRIQAINPAYTVVTGYTLEQMQTTDLLSQLSGPNRERTLRAIRRALESGDYWRGEIEFVRADGSLMPALFQINVIRDENGDFDGSVAITSDISHIKESERRLYQLAHFDTLTGLPNRLSLQEQLQTEIDDPARNGSFCLLYIDLDGFKLVNDSMGHPTGDALLHEVASRLRRSCRPGDLLTRIGGDEFALLMTVDALNDEIEAQAQRIFEALESPFPISEREIFIGASIGACRYPEHAGNAEEMLRNADSAMYEAKRLGRGQLCYYSAALTSESDHRLQVENELRVAIASDQLFLVYQPNYDAVTGAMVGAEALVRWRNPRRGVVPPGEFIGIAEASGLIIPLGEWVINEACRQLAAWQREYGRALPVAINISALHLREQSLLQVIGTAIARFDIDPQLLEIEITEDSLDFRGEDDKPYAMLNELAALGLSIAIDDFGTGYSSLSQLKKMPISTLKIDSSFVRDIAANESDHAIITAIVGLAKTLEMEIVAEGVENEEQAVRLRMLKCNVLQGFLYSKPLPAEELVQKFLAGPTDGEQ